MRQDYELAARAQVHRPHGGRQVQQSCHGASAVICILLYLWSQPAAGASWAKPGTSLHLRAKTCLTNKTAVLPK